MNSNINNELSIVTLTSYTVKYKYMVKCVACTKDDKGKIKQ